MCRKASIIGAVYVGIIFTILLTCTRCTFINILRLLKVFSAFILLQLYRLYIIFLLLLYAGLLAFFAMPENNFLLYIIIHNI